MTRTTFHLNVLSSKETYLAKLNLYVYKVESPCSYKDLARILNNIGVPFNFSKSLLYLTEPSEKVTQALKKAGYKVKSVDPVSFTDLFHSEDRNVLYDILYKSFESLLKDKGFYISKKHKRRSKKVALPSTAAYKGQGLIKDGKTLHTDYVCKEGFEYFFSILDDGGVTLRIKPSPSITIPITKIENAGYYFTPECTHQKCETFTECGIHKLGPVKQPREVDSTAVKICNMASDSLTMYCFKTKQLVAIPKERLFVEASPYNLRILGIYKKEYYTINKGHNESFDVTKRLINSLLENQKLTLKISSDISVEFEPDFEKFEVQT